MSYHQATYDEPLIKWMKSGTNYRVPGTEEDQELLVPWNREPGENGEQRAVAEEEQHARRDVAGDALLQLGRDLLELALIGLERGADCGAGDRADARWRAPQRHAREEPVLAHHSQCIKQIVQHKFPTRT